MTSDEIKRLANSDAVGDGLDLDVVLRTEVLMDVWTDIGEARWKRANTTLTLSANTRQANLPNDFSRMEMVKIALEGSEVLDRDAGLGYIGENPDLILKAEADAEPGRPGSYWIAQQSSGSAPPWKAIRFSKLAEQDFTVYYSYYTFPHFTDMQASVEFDQYMPRQWQSGLPKRLRMWILMDRFGQGDPRYDRVKQEYEEWLGKMLDRGSDLARRNRQVYV